jgi:N-acetylneuraminic acid mutarotase
LKSAYGTGTGSTGWKVLAEMKSARVNFAHLVLDNCVYAFGGISGRGTGATQHEPLLSTIIAEKYQPTTDSWEEIEVQGALGLAAFGWT